MPASALSRISRVVEIFSARRKRVVNNKSVGNVDREIELGMYRDNISNMIARPRLVAIKPSTKLVGSGKMIREMIATSSTAKYKSL